MTKRSILSWFTALLGSFASVGPAKSNMSLTPEEIEQLEQSGAFKPQFVIPLQLGTHPLLVLLSNRGLFDLQSVSNQLMMPVEKGLASQMGVSRYAETPIPSYLDGVRGQLDKIWASAQAAGAINGDDKALRRSADEVVQLRDTIKAALITGNVYVAD